MIPAAKLHTSSHPPITCGRLRARSAHHVLYTQQQAARTRPTRQEQGRNPQPDAEERVLQVRQLPCCAPCLSSPRGMQRFPSPFPLSLCFVSRSLRASPWQCAHAGSSIGHGARPNRVTKGAPTAAARGALSAALLPHSKQAKRVRVGLYLSADDRN
jgi:hypothetical protein